MQINETEVISQLAALKKNKQKYTKKHTNHVLAIAYWHKKEKNSQTATQSTCVVISDVFLHQTTASCGWTQIF